MSTLLLLFACARSPSLESAPEADTSAELAAFFDRVHEEELNLDPVRAAYLGVEHDETAWTSLSYAHAVAERDLAAEHLETLRTRFDPAALSEEDALSWRLFEDRQQRRIRDLEWFWHGYRINQMWGLHTWVPSFLSTVHEIDDVAGAASWIARVRGVPVLFDELGTILAEQEQKGILPPDFVYPHVLDAIDRITSGAPFDEDGTSPLLAHFTAEVADLDLDEATRDRLMTEAADALATSLAPAYAGLAAQLEAQSPDSRDGAWKLPDGEAYYAHRLQRYTTTELTAEEIHQLGLSEVARIQAEMVALMPALGVQGGLPELLEHLRTSEQYTLPNTDEGRETYLQRARDYVAKMEARLPEVFGLLPRAPLEVRRVEPWREGSSGKGFYQPASPDGSRPGYFYANLRDMSLMPTYQLEALVYHEGVPGHHMQNAVSQELDTLPPFRRFDGFTAYGEGWGLYSEYLPKELGLYDDPASDAGRLAMELWRAARLVVDTGIHHHRWTREEAITYLLENTPNPRGDAVHAIERYIVGPGQATAYKIGMLKILALRERASRALGDAFTLQAFHDVILGHGPLPLDVLEEQVEAWIAREA